MPLYFAYGSCMNTKDIARTVEAKLVGSARLYHYKLAFTRYSHSRKGGVADIVPSKGDMVEGMLFKVPDFKGLDAREGHPYFYRRVKVELYIERLDRWVTAYTYEVVNKAKEEVRPTKEYSLLIWNGAKRLSSTYRKILRANLLQPRKKYVPAPRTVPIYSAGKAVSKQTAKNKIKGKSARTKEISIAKPYKTERVPFDWDEFVQSHWDAWVYE